MVGGVRDKPPTKTPVLFKFSHCGFIHSRSAITTKKCTGTILFAKKKFQEHSKIIFCALVIKTSEMNVVYGHHLDEKQSYIYEKTFLAKIATVPISDSRKMDVVQFCYYGTVLLSFHIYLT